MRPFPSFAPHNLLNVLIFKLVSVDHRINQVDLRKDIVWTVRVKLLDKSVEVLNIFCPFVFQCLILIPLAMVKSGHVSVKLN